MENQTTILTVLVLAASTAAAYLYSNWQKELYWKNEYRKEASDLRTQLANA